MALISSPVKNATIQVVPQTDEKIGLIQQNNCGGVDALHRDITRERTFGKAQAHFYIENWTQAVFLEENCTCSAINF